MLASNFSLLFGWKVMDFNDDLDIFEKEIIFNN